jgi:hypothetical protein
MLDSKRIGRQMSAANRASNLNPRYRAFNIREEKRVWLSGIKLKRKANLKRRKIKRLVRNKRHKRRILPGNVFHNLDNGIDISN